MRKFNKLFQPEVTRVRIEGLADWYKVSAIHPSRQWINIHGKQGSYQRAHVVKYTNKQA